MMNEFDTDFSLDGLAIAPHLMFSGLPSPVDEENSPVISQNLPTEDKTLHLLPVDKEALMRFVFSDHAYSKPFPSYRSKHDQLAQPEKILQIMTHVKSNESFSTQSDGEEIDIESLDKPPIPAVRYNHEKARYAMNEVETYLNSLWKDVDKDDEEKFTRGTWSRDQSKFFDSAYKIINNYQLSKLAYCQNPNETVLRKLALDKATKRMRKLFGASFWNTKVIGWLHGIMIDCMGSSGFLCYLEIIQSLKRLVPSLVERTLLINSTANEKEQTAGLPNLGRKLKKSWDPSVGLQTNIMFDKLPTPPILITIPCGPSIPQQSTKRTRFWVNQLSHIGKPIPVDVPAYRTPDGYVIKHYLEHCISTTRAKIKECATHFPKRPVVLVGWGIGSLVAFKVGLLEKVDAIVCIGFPINGIGKINEDYWESMSKIECPVEFIVGTSSATDCKQRIEQLRSKMKVQTNLIVLEHGDELLRISKSRKRSLCLTQSMIDKLLLSEIYIFLKEILFKQRSLHSQDVSLKKKKRKMETPTADDSKRKKRPMTPKTTSPLNILDFEKTEKNPRNISPPLGLLTTTMNTLSSPKVAFTEKLSRSPQETGISLNIDIVGQKRSAPKDKENSKKAKKTVANKVLGNFLHAQGFTANLGSQRAGNLSARLFPVIATNAQETTATISKASFASGSFVVTGNPSQVQLKSTSNSSSNFIVQQPCFVKSTSLTSSTSATLHESVDETLITEGNDAALYLTEAVNRENSIPAESNQFQINTIKPSHDPTRSLTSQPALDLSNLAFLNSLADVTELAKFLVTHTAASSDSKGKPSLTLTNKPTPDFQRENKKISVVTSLDGSKKITYNPSKNKHLIGLHDPIPQKIKVPRLKNNKSKSNLIQVPKTKSISLLKGPAALGNEFVINRSPIGRNEFTIGSHSKFAVSTTPKITPAFQSSISPSRKSTLSSPFALSYSSSMLSAKMKEFSAKRSQPKSSQFPHTQILLTSSKEDLQKAADDVKLVNVLNAFRQSPSTNTRLITHKSRPIIFTDELIAPRTSTPSNNTTPTSTIVDDLFTSEKIPVELERNEDVKDSVDFSISSKYEVVTTCVSSVKPSIKPTFLYEKSGKEKLSSIDIQLMQKILQAAAEKKPIVSKTHSELSVPLIKQDLNTVKPTTTEKLKMLDKSQNVNFPKVILKDFAALDDEKKIITSSIALESTDNKMFVSTGTVQPVYSKLVSTLSPISSKESPVISIDSKTNPLNSSLEKNFSSEGKDNISSSIDNSKRNVVERKIYPERSTKQSNITIQKILAEKTPKPSVDEEEAI